MTILDEQTLRRLYSEEKQTEQEIADRYGVVRTSITHLRRKYRIPPNFLNSEIGRKEAAKMLEKQGFTVYDAKAASGTTIFDLLVNDRILLEVMSAHVVDEIGSAKFSLSNKEQCEMIESDIRIRLDNGRTRKLFRKTCDFVLFVVIEPKQTNAWIIPSDHIPDTLQTLGLNANSQKSKYNEYKNNWSLLGNA